MDSDQICFLKMQGWHAEKYANKVVQVWRAYVIVRGS